MPGSKNIGANIKELEAANKGKAKGKKRPMKQIIAIALEQARAKGAKV
jgi:hypothetical protein